MKIKNRGFTIVELLVVIVVIGILAAITIVSYRGISGRATTASLQSDLANASKKLKMYQIEYGSFPVLSTVDASGNYCPTSPVDVKYCIKASFGNTFSYFPVFGSNPQTFTIVATNTTSTTKYNITDNSAPVLGSGNWIAGIAATALANKWVYNVDLGSTYQFKTANTAIISPQGNTGLDPNHNLNMVLVNPQTNPSVDFSAYPAQNACKAIGGRLPNTQEASAIYVGRASYGNNLLEDFYWSSTEYDTTTTYFIDFYDGTKYSSIYHKLDSLNVRCVAG